MSDISVAEQEELAEHKELQLAAKTLMENSNFKKVILKGYIEEKALNTGTSFTNSNEDVDTLKAVSHLMTYLAGFN